MGCWNGTCAISHLPIQSGTKIKLLLLTSNPRELSKLSTTSGYVYSNDLFSPALLPISGTYDDYGGIDNIEDNLESRTAPILLTAGVDKIKIGEKEYDVSKLFAEEEGYKKVLTLILNGIERGEYAVFKEGDKTLKKLAQGAVEAYKDAYSSERVGKEWEEMANMDVSAKWRSGDVSFVMIREDVWDQIVEKSGYEKSYYSRTGDGMLTGREHYHREFYNAVESIRKTEALVDDGSEEYYKEYFDSISSIDAGLNYLFQMSGYSGGKGMMGPDILVEILKQSIKESKEDKMFTPWLELRLIESFMSGTRRGWIPQPGAGSQHNGWEEHKLIAEITANVCKENIAQEKAWDEEDA